MKIWYQSYSPVGTDSRWGYYEEALKKHIPKIARPDTEVDIHGVEVFAPKMLKSSYLQYLHIAQVFEKALQAEREGYDAFVLGGMRDFAYLELKELIDIPVAFIAEASYSLAYLLALKFSIIEINATGLQARAALMKRYGVEDRGMPPQRIPLLKLELPVF